MSKMGDDAQEGQLESNVSQNHDRCTGTSIKVKVWPPDGALS